jgi:CxxC motif-containing protein
MNRKSMICINCPKGCSLETGWNDVSDLKVSGNGCPRGIEYATSEIFNPTRIITATVAAADPGTRRIPVKSAKPVKKELIPSILDKLYRIKVSLPIASGDVVLKNACGSGVDIVATGSSAK